MSVCRASGKKFGHCCAISHVIPEYHAVIDSQSRAARERGQLETREHVGAGTHGLVSPQDDPLAHVPGVAGVPVHWDDNVSVEARVFKARRP